MCMNPVLLSVREAGDSDGKIHVLFMNNLCCVFLNDQSDFNQKQWKITTSQHRAVVFKKP